ncbi:MAG: tail fiber domain-containing protein [Pleurocapsa sp. MO_226.B13]|nr:tail fiber domain-containing protein [Pleurocapsa sp. MO_226.B13]
MPVEAKDGLRFILTPSDKLSDPFNSQTEWPRLSCPQANQLALEFGDLSIDKSLTVKDAIATKQLSVTDQMTGSLKIENNLTVGASLFTSKVNATGTIKANAFQGDGSSLDNIVKKTGDTVTGSLSIQNNLTVKGNINTTGIISGSSLPPNLIRNSYMNIPDGNKPAGYSVLGNVTLELEHPHAKGFEGPYVSEKPSNAATSVDTATQANPYWFGRYNKGSRASRGGLADGWHSISDGRILKITGDNSGEHTCVFFPFEYNVLTNKVHFKAWLKITSGSRVGFGVDSGYKNVARGLVITKGQTDAAQDGWYQIDAVIGISEVTSLDGLAFSIGIEASSSFEVYLALPYLANLDNDTWLPSVSDMLSRDGLTIHPSSSKVGIGITNPLHLVHLSGGAYCDGRRWEDASSLEYKQDVKQLALSQALDTLTELNPVTFQYKEEKSKQQVGFIAEEVPELVASNDRKGLSPMDIVGILTKVVQHQQIEIDELKARLNESS